MSGNVSLVAWTLESDRLFGVLGHPLLHVFEFLTQEIILGLRLSYDHVVKQVLLVLNSGTHDVVEAV